MSAKKVRLDVTEHRSQPVTAELVAASTLILAMERYQVIDLVNSYGADLRRTFTVPELAALTRLHPSRPRGRHGVGCGSTGVAADADADERPVGPATRGCGPDRKGDASLQSHRSNASSRTSPRSSTPLSARSC